ncbi:MAG: 16S rRNA (adenine(1518)-N(6)/adenine(1519)-N(6))-dimethyltransferase RsmA [Candidatus Peribacteraceae bacterium]|nr:16S rRNA (adenine(1518)-N(6)/adenine(1519)-N(6))-dimethyltransferase RsmA [Candidatus Peribacteraceae bacterium]
MLSISQSMTALPEEIRRFCSSHGLRLNTDLGQHFLLDASILDHIVETALIKKDDTVVEIGPGIGVLTRKLLERAGSVIAIELDGRLIPLLREFTGENAALTVTQGNALHIAMPSTPYKVVANIPYHITSPLLRHLFLESTTTPSALTLLIQREVAEKICDREDAGILTILVGLFGKPRIAGLVPPEAFLPPPKVDSAILHIECFGEPLTGREIMERIFKLVKIGFGQKRKMLSNTIGRFSWGMELLERASIDPKRRPQTLSVEEWIALAKEMPEDEG